LDTDMRSERGQQSPRVTNKTVEKSQELKKQGPPLPLGKGRRQREIRKKGGSYLPFGKSVGAQ